MAAIKLKSLPEAVAVNVSVSQSQSHSESKVVFFRYLRRVGSRRTGLA